MKLSTIFGLLLYQAMTLMDLVSSRVIEDDSAGSGESVTFMGEAVCAGLAHPFCLWRKN